MAWRSRSASRSVSPIAYAYTNRDDLAADEFGDDDGDASRLSASLHSRHRSPSPLGLYATSIRKPTGEWHWEEPREDLRRRWSTAGIRSLDRGEISLL